MFIKGEALKDRASLLFFLTSSPYCDKMKYTSVQKQTARKKFYVFCNLFVFCTVY